MHFFTFEFSQAFPTVSLSSCHAYSFSCTVGKTLLKSRQLSWALYGTGQPPIGSCQTDLWTSSSSLSQSARLLLSYLSLPSDLLLAHLIVTVAKVSVGYYIWAVPIPGQQIYCAPPSMHTSPQNPVQHSSKNCPWHHPGVSWLACFLFCCSSGNFEVVKKIPM